MISFNSLRITLASVIGLTVCLASPMLHASFESFYQGSPDLVLSALEQQSATTFRFKVCNQWDISTGDGKINIVLESNEGETEERTYKNVNIPSGSCLNFSMYAVDGYASAKKRKTSIVATVRFEGTRRELRTTNNRIVLAPKKSLVSVTDPGYSTSSSTKNPVYDLWGTGDDGTKWYNANQTYSGGGYRSGSTNPNGDFNPSNPTWEMQQGARNIVYVYTGPGSGGWYVYAPNNNGTYTYTQYNPNSMYYNNGYYYYTNGNSIGSSTTNSYNTFVAGPPTRTNTYSTFDLNGNGDSVYNTSSNSSSSSYYYNPWNYNTPCQRWVNVWNSADQRYDWKCSNDPYIAPVGNPDIYVSQLRQSGSKSEFIARVCNQGDSMTSSQQIAIKLTNGQYNTTTSTFIQLLRAGCIDVTIPFGNLNLNWPGAYYLIYAESDIYNNIVEAREDNNTSYWRIQLQ